MALSSAARSAIREAVSLAPPIPDDTLDRLAALFSTVHVATPPSRVGTDVSVDLTRREVA